MIDFIHKIFSKILWIPSIVLFFLVYCSQVLSAYLGKVFRKKAPFSKKQAIKSFKAQALSKKRVRSRKQPFKLASLKRKRILIPLAAIFMAFFFNFAYEVYSAYSTPVVEAPEELYLLEEASAYVKDTALFEAGVKDLAGRLEVPPEWLMAVMYMESRFNPAIENRRGSGAVGLIQFMVPTVREMNMRLGRRLYMKDIQNMSAVEQLELVENYLQTVRKRRGEFNSLTDLYLAVLYPKAINRGLSYKLFSKPSKRYRQNSGLDMNKDGIVNVQDIDTRMAKMFPKAYDIKKTAPD